MLASFVVTALAALSGCGGAPSEPPSAAPVQPLAADPLGGVASCASYADMPEVLAYCRYQTVRQLPTLKRMEAACAAAGEWERDCRQAWVHDRMDPRSGVDTPTLMRACGSNADCAFELLDFRPIADPVEQVAFCQRYASHYLEHCAGHGMQRWWRSRPSEEEHARVAAAEWPGTVARQVGYWLAVDVACSHVGTCGATTAAVRLACEQALPQFTEPKNCPSARGSAQIQPTATPSGPPARTPPPPAPPIR